MQLEESESSFLAVYGMDHDGLKPEKANIPPGQLSTIWTMVICAHGGPPKATEQTTLEHWLQDVVGIESTCCPCAANQ